MTSSNTHPLLLDDVLERWDEGGVLPVWRTSHAVYTSDGALLWATRTEMLPPGVVENRDAMMLMMMTNRTSFASSSSSSASIIDDTMSELGRGGMSASAMGGRGDAVESSVGGGAAGGEGGRGAGGGGAGGSAAFNTSSHPRRSLVSSVKAAVSLRYGAGTKAGRPSLEGNIAAGSSESSSSSSSSSFPLPPPHPHPFGLVDTRLHASTLRVLTEEADLRMLMKSPPGDWPDMCWNRVFAVVVAGGAGTGAAVAILRASAPAAREIWTSTITDTAMRFALVQDQNPMLLNGALETLTPAAAAMTSTVPVAGAARVVAEGGRRESIARSNSGISGANRPRTMSMGSPKASPPFLARSLSSSSNASAAMPSLHLPSTASSSSFSSTSTPGPSSTTTAATADAFELPPRPNGVDKATLDFLRRMRRKPDLVLSDPARAYAMLVRAARGHDAHNEKGVLLHADAASGVANAASFSAASASGAAATASLSDDGNDGNSKAAGAAGGGKSSSRVFTFECQQLLRRSHWSILVPRYMPLLGDAYTHGKIFDMLTGDSAPVSIRMLVPAVDNQMEDAAGGTQAGGVPRVAWQSIQEKVLRYDAFERYLSSLARTLLSPPSAWAALREALELDPRELVVKVETYVECVFTAEVEAKDIRQILLAQMSSAGSRAAKKEAVAAVGGGGGGTLGAAASAHRPSSSSSSSYSASPRPTVAHTLITWPLALPQQFDPLCADSRRRLLAESHISAGGTRSLRRFALDVEAAEERAKRAALYDSESTLPSSSWSDGDEAAAAGDGRKSRRSRKTLNAETSQDGAKPRAKRSSLLFSAVAAVTRPRSLSAASTFDATAPPATAVVPVKSAKPLTIGDAKKEDGGTNDNGLRRRAVGGEMIKKERRASAVVERRDRAGEGEGRFSGIDDDSETDEQLHFSDIPRSTPHQRNDDEDDDDDQDEEAEERAWEAEFDALALGTEVDVEESGEGGGGQGALDDSAGASSAADGRLRSFSVLSDGEGGAGGKGDGGAGTGGGSAGGGSAGGAAATSGGGLTSWLRNKGSNIRSTIQGAAMDKRSQATALLARVGAKAKQVVVSAAAPHASSSSSSSSSAAAGAAAASQHPSGGVAHTYAGSGLNHAVASSLLVGGKATVHVRGTFVLTERNIYFTAGRNEILVIPIPSITAVENVSAQARTFGMGVGVGLLGLADNGISLGQCEVRRVPLDADIDAETGNDATALKSVFALGAALDGQRMPPASGIAPAAGANALPPGTASVELAVRPSVTFIFSQMKDLLVGRGDERKTGGRRQVVRTALEELVAAHSVAAGYGALLERLAADAARASSNAAASTTNGTGFLSPSESVPSSSTTTTTHAVAAAAGVSPAILEAVGSTVTLARLWSLPFTVSAWKAALSRSRDEHVAVARRLPAFAAVNLVRSRALLKATGKSTSLLLFCTAYIQGTDTGAATAVRRLMLSDDPQWLLRLASWMSHEREVERARAEATTVFDRKRLKGEMDTLLDTLFFPLKLARRAVQYVVAWEAPPLTATVLFLAITIVWYDLLSMIVPLLLFLQASVVLVYGSLTDDARMAVETALTRPRGSKARNLLERLRNFRTSLGANQARMRRINTVLLKLRSLYAWRDPPRTAAFFAVLCCFTVIFALVPARWLFGALCAHAFTRPLRRNGRGIVGIAWRRFWDGLPLPSASDAVYAPAPERRLHGKVAGMGMKGGHSAVGSGGGGGAVPSAKWVDASAHVLK